MIHTAKLTAKYQVTLPRAVRQRLRAQIGDTVLYRETDSGEVVLEVVPSTTADQLLGRLSGPHIVYVPLAEARRQAQDEQANGHHPPRSIS
ncbi:MAG: type II toxin-antitoxin system PrlF family antitoxin [Thermaerobacter sp.]|nr:type II toxin-antitoxin system PrlF family antitoxin [Thermaerobacter sp.]